MSAAELFELVAALDWAPAATLRHTEDDASALEIAYPVACPHGGILWRHVVLLALTPQPAGLSRFPACYYDYANQWTVSLIVMLSDGPYSEDAGKDAILPHLLLVDLSSALVARWTETEMVNAIRHELDLDWTGSDVAASVAAVEADARPLAADTELDLLCTWLRVYLDVLDLFAALVADRRTEDPTSTVGRWHALEFSTNAPPQVQIDHGLFNAATSLLEDVAAHVATFGRTHWEPCLEVSRALTTLGVRARFCRSLGDSVTRILQASTRLDFPYLGQLVAAGLPDAGPERMSLLFDGIATLELRDDSVIDALMELAESGDRLTVMPALQLLGRLGAQRARPVIEECLSDYAASVREAAQTALLQLDAPPAARGRPLPTEATADITETPAFPNPRYFRGPRGTTLSVSNLAEDGSFCTVVTTHPDGTRDAAMGGRGTLRAVAAQLQGLIPPSPKERTVAMGEAAIFDEKTGEVRKIRLSDGADSTETGDDDQ